MGDQRKINALIEVLTRSLPSNALARPPPRNALLSALLAPPPDLSGMGLLDNALSQAPAPKAAQIPYGLLDHTLPFPAAQTQYLPPNEEAAYRAWMKKIGHTKERGFSVKDDFSGENYDYRGFFKKYGPVPIGEGQHFTDEFKLPSHPTFSNESIFATGAAAPFAGSWEGEVYTPSPTQYVRGKRRFLSE